MSNARWSRRDFLAAIGKGGAGVAALGAAAFSGHEWWQTDGTRNADQAKPDPAKGVRRFVSRPDLTPPAVTTTHRRKSHAGSTASRYIFLTPKGYHGSGPGAQGPMIVDRNGAVVWFLPTPGADHIPNNFAVQQYHGKPVLTWWEGRIIDGHGTGEGIVMDTSYRRIATVRATDGLHADLHEFRLTPNGTALISAYRPVTTDLSTYGGSTRGTVYTGVIQEIDVASGKCLFQWDSLDHVPLSESYAQVKDDTLDYFHLNSIEPTPNGDLLISARNTCALYQISRDNGTITWRVGGKNSDFSIGKGAHFYWQHDARWHSGNRISLFDDGSSPAKESQSRGLVLLLDPTAKRVTVQRQYTHPSRLLADNQGSVQLLDDGHVFVGWGAEPYFSEFDADGTIVLDGRLPPNDQSYRTYADQWTARPNSDPDIAVGSNPARGATIYASWNGATELDHWIITAGATPTTLTETARATRTGFETAIAVNNDGPYYMAIAHDHNGKELGRTKVIRA